MTDVPKFKCYYAKLKGITVLSAQTRYELSLKNPSALRKAQLQYQVTLSWVTEHLRLAREQLSTLYSVRSSTSPGSADFSQVSFDIATLEDYIQRVSVSAQIASLNYKTVLSLRPR